MKRKPLTTGITIAAASLLALTGCASGAPGAASDSSWSIPSEDPTATISFVGVTDPANGMNDIVAAFEEEHPTITVEYEYVPFGDLNTVLDSRISNKQGSPDLFYVDQPRIAALAERGYLEDLTEQFGGYSDLFFDSAVEADTYKDRLYAVAMASSTPVLFYNKDILDAAGITPPAVDEQTTWETLKENGAKAQASGAAKHGFLFQQPRRYYQLQTMPVSLGGGNGVEGEENLTPALVNDEWLEAMEFYQSLFSEGIVPKDISDDQSDIEFTSGKAAYSIATTDMVGRLADSTFNWGASLQPTFEGTEPVTGTGGFSVGMNPFSKNKEAASIFLKWMLVDGVDGDTGYSTYRPGGVLPSSKQALEVYLNQPAFTDEQGSQVAEVIKLQTDSAVPRPTSVGFIEFEEITGRMLSDISNGTDPKTALEAAEAELTSVWTKYTK